MSLSHLPSEVLIRSFTPYPRGRLRAASGACGVRQSEGLQDASEHLMTRNSELGYNITTAQLVDRRHKVRIRVPFSLLVVGVFLILACHSSRRRRQLNHSNMTKTGNPESFVKSECSERKRGGKFE